MNHYLREMVLYSQCPEYYYKHCVDNTPELRIPWRVHYRACLRFAAIEYFKIWRREGRQPSSESLISIWDEIWKDPMALTWGERDTHDAWLSTGEAGRAALVEMHKLLATEPTLAGADLIEVESEFSHTLDWQEPRTVTGIVDLVFTKGMIEVIRIKLAAWGIDDDKNKDPRIQHDHELAVWGDMMYGDTSIRKIAYLSIDNPGGVKLKYVTRSEADKKATNESLLAISKAMEQGLRWKNWSSRCKSCRYVQHCAPERR